MLKGALIAESLRVGTALEGVPLCVTRITRYEPSNISPQQLAAGLPRRWTILDFEAKDDQAQPLAEALARVLDPTGWYVDFHSQDEEFVVFSGQIFRYRRGDAKTRAEAQAHGRSHGVPEAQLDWPG